MTVKGSGHYMTVTDVTITTRSSSGSSQRWEQWVSVSFDHEGEDVNLEDGDDIDQRPEDC